MNSLDEPAPRTGTPRPAFVVERSIGFQLRRLTNLLSAEVERRMEPLGLTDAQWKPLLRLLIDPPGSAAGLARMCHLDTGGLTRLLDRLEAKGLCQRERSQEDRRVMNIALTPEGRAVAERIPAILSEVQAQLLRGFSTQEEEQLRGFLARLYDNTRALSGPS